MSDFSRVITIDVKNCNNNPIWVDEICFYLKETHYTFYIPNIVRPL